VRRRDLLLSGLASLTGLVRPTHATESAPARVHVYHIHTGEALDVAFREHGLLSVEALAEIDRVLRDFRSGQARCMDISLLDILDTLHAEFGRRGRFEVVSAYRSPRTNEALRRATTGVAKESFHLLGRAIDVRLTSAATTDLRDAALALGRGGVGFYPDSNFVHLDTGGVRSWQG
jgi:uncharacterized protein YcbK (DUF882 family)